MCEPLESAYILLLSSRHLFSRSFNFRRFVLLVACPLPLFLTPCGRGSFIDCASSFFQPYNKKLPHIDITQEVCISSFCDLLITRLFRLACAFTI
jgi:hypothetical protein